MSSDTQFTADGPATVGFQTNGANIKRGADLAGTEVGVRGVCNTGPGVGVVGTGSTVGVTGAGPVGVLGNAGGAGPAGIGVSGVGAVGVSGTGENPPGEPATTSPIGVTGTGSIGVLGVLVNQAGVAPPADFAAGVFGAAFGDFSNGTFRTQSVGVRGLSTVGVGVQGDSDSSHGVSGSTSSASRGVAGVSGSSEGEVKHIGEVDNVAGVSASSLQGNGLDARSLQGYAAVFRTGFPGLGGGRAQIHLVPSETQKPQGVTPGRAGDLLAAATTDPPDGATLWFCVRTGDASTALWKQIV